MVISGLLIILAMVLIMPFLFRKIEENLEAFLFIMGVAAALLSGKIDGHLLKEALCEPVMIAGAVLIAGAIFYLYRKRFANLINILGKRIPLSMMVFLTVLLLGLLSSVITAIVASIVLIEIINQLPLCRKDKVLVCVLACYAIGLGAALTPIGEPLATITITKLDEEFFYLLNLLGKYIIPSIFVFSLLAGFYTRWATRCQGITDKTELFSELAATSDNSIVEVEDEELSAESSKEVIIRALKVYLFVMALIFLGEGFEPLIDRYILSLQPQLLYWVNIVSAVLDNATLCAAEISPAMLSNSLTIRAILMGLLVSGGMLIPGNIPNIISASKLRIGSKEWALYGIPIGLVFLIMFYMLIFFIGF